MEKLNVLLVDDENIVIEDMSSLIDWDTAGFHLSGFAYNGTQARKAMQKCPADIVFMDISLPDTDGIRLSKQLCAIYPDLLVIILSGYMDFSYAQGAVEIGAFSYLVKHQLTASRLLEVLANARDVLEKKRLTALLNSRLIIRDILDHNTVISPFISETLSAYQKPFLPVLIVPALSLPACGSNQHSQVHQPHVSLLLNLQEKNLRVQDVLLWETNFLIFLTPNSDSYTGTRYLDSLSAMIRQLLECFRSENTCSFIALHLDHETTLSTLYADCHALEATHNLWRFYPGQWIFPVSSSEYLSEKELPSTDFSFFKRDLFLNSNEEFLSHLQRIFSLCLEEKNIAVFSDCCSKLLHLLKEIDPELHINIPGQYISEIQTTLLDQCAACYNEFQQKKNYSPSTNYTLQYICTNYKNTPTIADVAVKLKSNPMYLGQKFRKETGYTFHDYLNKYRIDKAKELLLNPDLKIFEISEAVGISNSQYFSKLFRQFADTTPNEYRREHSV